MACFGGSLRKEEKNEPDLAENHPVGKEDFVGGS
jgi:hypothetical protein